MTGGGVYSQYTSARAPNDVLAGRLEGLFE